MGGPFSVRHVSILSHMKSIYLIALAWQSALCQRPRGGIACPGELVHTAFIFIYRLHPLLGLGVTTAEGVFEGVKIGIERADACGVDQPLARVHGGVMRKRTSSVIGHLSRWVLGDGVS
jgi:hypothetical protein